MVDNDISDSDDEEEDENLPTSKSLLQNELERVAKILFPNNNHCTVHVFTLAKLNISQSCEQILKKITNICYSKQKYMARLWQGYLINHASLLALCKFLKKRKKKGENLMSADLRILFSFTYFLKKFCLKT